MYSIYKTHTGLVRQVNQDYGMISQLDDETTLVIVADGMGGHKAGEIASQMAADIIHSEIVKHWQQKSWEDLLLHAVQQANITIIARGKDHVEFEGMGTTIEIGLLSQDRGLIAHVGDSRVYLLIDSNLKQLTEDHSLVYALYKNGQISLEEIANHPQKNVILRAIGTDDEIEVDFIPFTWRKGDRILFCSDGLFKYVDNAAISTYLQSSLSVADISDQLIQTALDRGGDDNITVILVENTLPRVGGEGQ